MTNVIDIMTFPKIYPYTDRGYTLTKTSKQGNGVRLFCKLAIIGFSVAYKEMEVC